jgi:2-desacetyl-2-hydroxyethyl bacteriochlorophyllide A dehydrogenase
MKALYMASSREFGLVERPRPQPKPDEALVRVARVAICHTDVIIRSGKAGHVNYPVIPGHEFSGVVEECGAQVKYIHPGDRVAVHTILACGECLPCRMGDVAGCERYDELGSKRDGGFAEYCTVPARHLFKLPDHVSLEQAALVEPLANAVAMVRQADVKLGERVVVMGPGPIGLLALQVARLAYPSVLVLVGTRDERLAFGKGFGATHTINVLESGAKDALKQVLKGKGADVVMECAGACSALELAMEIVGWRGRIAVEGAFDTQETVPISPYNLLMNRSAQLLGICGWVTPDFVRALDLIASGLVDVKSLVTHVFPLEQWEVAFDMITRHKSQAIKVQLAPGGDA